MVCDVSLFLFTQHWLTLISGVSAVRGSTLIEPWLLHQSMPMLEVSTPRHAHDYFSCQNITTLHAWHGFVPSSPKNTKSGAFILRAFCSQLEVRVGGNILHIKSPTQIEYPLNPDPPWDGRFRHHVTAPLSQRGNEYFCLSATRLFQVSM